MGQCAVRDNAGDFEGSGRAMNEKWDVAFDAAWFGAIVVFAAVVGGGVMAAGLWVMRVFE